ncbi:MAG: DUF4124 domain-containing protein [Thiotrichaceae bacterium]
MKTMTLASVALLLMTLATATSAQIYKWVDENGQLHYTERPAPDGQKTEAIEDKIRYAAALRSKKKTQSPYIPSGYQREAEESDEVEIKREDVVSKQKEAQDDYRKQLDAYCTSQQNNLTLLRTSSPIAWEEDGNTELLTKQQKTDKITEISKNVEKNCSKQKSAAEKS